MEDDQTEDFTPMGPIRSYTIRARIVSIEKGEPVLLEPEELSWSPCLTSAK